MSESSATPDLRGTRREVFAWAMYDWASSAYSTISITVLLFYLAVVLDPLYPKLGALVWGWGIGLSMFLAAILSPILGAVADAHASKRTWLAITGLGGALASCMMYFATPDRPWLLVALFFLAHLGSELSLTFYNGFLPEIADDNSMGRISAWGYIVGYLGGAIALLIAMLMITFHTELGLPAVDAPQALVPRLALLIMGLWWAIFMIPTLLWIKDAQMPTSTPQSLTASIRRAFRDVGNSIRNIRRYRSLALFLLAFLIFNDGVQTVISQASEFAKSVLEMGPGELTQIVLMIQLVAMPGAWLIGHLAERFGQKQALVLCLATWTIILIAAFFVTTRLQFWIMAAIVAMVLGGTQSVSRAIMGLMTPEKHTAEFFGFFNLSGKATSVLGPMLFSTIIFTTNNAHLALVSLLVFFVVGWALLMPVDIDRGRREARAPEI